MKDEHAGFKIFLIILVWCYLVFMLIFCTDLNEFIL